MTGRTCPPRPAAHRLGAIVRRLAKMAVLLLSLTGVVPAALACSVLAQDTDCCLPDQPCDTERAPTLLASSSASCCEMLPVELRTVMAVATSSPDHCAVLAHQILSARSPQIAAIATPVAGDLHPDQQQTYLLTGRLRL